MSALKQKERKDRTEISFSVNLKQIGGLLNKETAYFCNVRLPDRQDRKRSVALLTQAGETYTFITFSACGPFGPCVTSNSTS